jgi:hypothetical protein
MSDNGTWVSTLNNSAIDFTSLNHQQPENDCPEGSILSWKPYKTSGRNPFGALECQKRNKRLNVICTTVAGMKIYKLNVFLNFKISISYLLFSDCSENGANNVGIQIDAYSISSHQACQTICQTRSNCQSWSYSVNQDCFLYSNVFPILPDPSYVSGPKFC